MDKNNLNRIIDQRSIQGAHFVQLKLLDRIFALSPAIIRNPHVDKFGFILAELDPVWASCEKRIAQEIAYDLYEKHLSSQGRISSQTSIGSRLGHIIIPEGMSTIGNYGHQDVHSISFGGHPGLDSQNTAIGLSNRSRTAAYQNSTHAALTSNHLGNSHLEAYRTTGVRAYHSALRTTSKDAFLGNAAQNAQNPTSLFLDTSTSRETDMMSRSLAIQSTSPISPASKDGNMNLKPKKTAATKGTRMTKKKLLETNGALEAQLKHVLGEKDTGATCPCTSNSCDQCPKSSK